jgi:hypothetical protein
MWRVIVLALLGAGVSGGAGTGQDMQRADISTWRWYVDANRHRQQSRPEQLFESAQTWPMTLARQIER